MDTQEKLRFDVLYQNHLTTLTLQGKATKTIDAYSRAVRRLAAFVDRCPDDVSVDELRSFFAALIKSHAWSTVKLDLNGLRFFYRYVLARELPWLDIVRPPKVQSLPDILTCEEVANIIHRTRDPQLQAFWFVTYSMGLRLGETLNLTVHDIDRQRRTLHIRHGKGRKDRFVILPDMTLRVLERLWREHRHPRRLFPAKASAGAADKVRHRGTVQRAFRRACQDAGINKRVSIHSLRHSYATHLIEAGLNLRSLQQQLGHADPNTTVRYVRLSERTQNNSAELIDDVIARLTHALRYPRRQP
jgi:site-specific recombinase XerD